MATGKIPVQGGSVIDVEPIPASSSNPNPHNYYDISMKYVSGIVFFCARIALSSAGGPYSHYCIPAQYAPTMGVVLNTAWGSDANAGVNACANVSDADSSGNRQIRVINATPAASGSVLLIYGSWPVG